MKIRTKLTAINVLVTVALITLITVVILNRAAASGTPLPASPGKPPHPGSGRAGARSVAIPGTAERDIHDGGKNKTAGRAWERQLLGGL